MKRTKFFAIFLVLFLLLTACGASVPAEKYAGGEVGYDNSMNSGESYDSAAGETIAGLDLKTESAELEAPVQSDRKLIKTVEIDAETKHYDDLISALDGKITTLGGYTESRRTGKYGSSRRWSSMTIRIPADKLGDFLTHVEKNANILSTSEDTRDVTLQYSDTEAKITALKTEQSRLLELLAGANNLSEILEVEARLSDVTYELERYESQKRGYDNQITYATVHLNLNEVQTLTPMEEPTVWQRIRTGFTTSLRGVSDGFVDLFVLLTVGSPYIVVYGAVIALGLFVTRKLLRKRSQRQADKPSETP